MAIRKASAYSKYPSRPFTRNSKNKSRSYIKTIPSVKIAKYRTGDQVSYKTGKHTFKVQLFSDEAIHIRDTALEAGRMALNKSLEEKIPGQFYMEVKVVPHHLLRENKTAAGAGADRMSTGMTQSFGIVIGRAARVIAGQEIFFVSCANLKGAQTARDALASIKAKLPCKSRIVVVENKA